MGEKQETGKDIFTSLASEAPLRELESTNEHKTLEEVEVSAPEATDLQTALTTLFPDIGRDKIDRALMMARIAPDMFIPMIRILVNDDIKRLDPHKPFSVARIAALYYIENSIGLDGKGRIDAIETTGSIKENAEDLEEIYKGMSGLNA